MWKTWGGRLWHLCFSLFRSSSTSCLTCLFSWFVCCLLSLSYLFALSMQGGGSHRTLFWCSPTKGSSPRPPLHLAYNTPALHLLYLHHLVIHLFQHVCFSYVTAIAPQTPSTLTPPSLPFLPPQPPPSPWTWFRLSRGRGAQWGLHSHLVAFSLYYCCRLYDFGLVFFLFCFVFRKYFHCIGLQEH